MKRIILFITILLMAVTLTACGTTTIGNRAINGADVQTFTYGYIRLGDRDIVEGYITQWRDYTNSDVIQLMIDGKYYLTHYSCVVMVADPAHGNIGYDLTGELN